jgi:hypothetical protein
MPVATSGLGPTRGISTIVDMFAERAMPAAIGRKATPVTTGE